MHRQRNVSNLQRPTQHLVAPVWKHRRARYRVARCHPQSASFNKQKWNKTDRVCRRYMGQPNKHGSSQSYAKVIPTSTVSVITVIWADVVFVQKKWHKCEAHGVKIFDV